MKTLTDLQEYLHAVMANKACNGVGRFYFDQPLAFTFDNASKLAYFETQFTSDAIINDLLFDIRALGELTQYSLKETRGHEIAEQALLNVERKLYPSDRVAIWAKIQGYQTVEEAARALGNDLCKGEDRMTKDGVPQVVHSPFNDDGILYPIVGLSWSATLGAGMRLAKGLLSSTRKPIRVSSDRNARVRLTNQGSSERMDGQPATYTFEGCQYGMTLQLDEKINLTVHLGEVEAFSELPFQISRYAILQRLLAHVCGVEVGRFTVLAERVYRGPRSIPQLMKFIHAIDIYDKSRLQLKITKDESVPGKYEATDFQFEFAEQELSNVTSIR